MALNNVPLAGQNLAVTRNPINQNFVTIDTAFAIDHIGYALANQGMHKWVEFPTVGTPAVVGGKIDLYPKLNNAGSFQSARNEVFIQPSGNNPAGVLGTAYPLTANSTNVVNGGTVGGWTYLPSGLVMQWGSAPTGSGLAGPVLFPVPFPNAVLNVSVTSSNTGGNRATVQYNGLNGLIGFNTYTWLNNVNVPGDCTFIAIGY